MYHFLQRRSPKLKGLDFQVSSYLPASQAQTGALASSSDQLLFTLTFVAPAATAR
jgi:hypothetical protein